MDGPTRLRWGETCSRPAPLPLRGAAFILHACEGVDAQSQEELFELDRLGLLDATTVLVHGLAIDKAGHALIRKRGASLIVCPSSNEFLFGVRPDASSFGDCAHVAIGNDSPLTAVGDLLDEARFAIGFGDISPRLAYRMITETPAAILKLRSGTERLPWAVWET